MSCFHEKTLILQFIKRKTMNMIKITFPDGSLREYEMGVTGLQIAESISSRLATLQKEFPDNLRKSVLQQAIHGKLTERDPSDEPASVLLKRINAKKERLIRDGKIRKEKPAPSITEEEIPFEIPDGTFIS